MASEYGVTSTSAIPMGVDTEYFTCGWAEAPDPEIVFIGSMDWLPNQDAVDYFLADILPRITRAVPVRFTIVGRNPPDRIKRLDNGASVRVSGTVPDIRPWLGRAHVCVVPLRIGGGTRLKIFEALSMGKAVVSTTIGAEGLPVTTGVDLLLADDPPAFAAGVVHLLQDTTARRRLGAAGRRLVSSHYSWGAAAARFSDICRTTLRSSRTDQR